MAEACQIPDTPNKRRGPGADLVREPVDGSWGPSGDIVGDNSCGAIFLGSKWCELYRVRAEVH